MKTVPSLLMALTAASSVYLAIARVPSRSPGGATDAATVQQVDSAGAKALDGWTQVVEIEGPLPKGAFFGVSVESMQGGARGGKALRPDLDSYVRKHGERKFILKLEHSSAERWFIIDGGSLGRASWKVEKPEVPGVKPKLVKVRLKGPGKLSGQVLDGADKPVPGVRLVATWVPSETDEALDGSCEPYRSYLIKRGGGQIEVEAVTDKDGRYFFEGLLEGRFRMDAERRTGRDDLREREVFGFHQAAPQPKPAELRFNQYNIAVAVDRGPEDASCNLALYDAGPDGSLPWARSGWDFRTGLPIPKAYAWLSGPGSDRQGYDGTTGVFWVREGRQYLLSARGAGYDPRPQLVRVPQNGASGQAAVAPWKASAQATSKGTVRIRLSLGAVEEPEGADDHDFHGDKANYGVFVQDAETAMPLGVFEREDLEKGPIEISVPAGRIKVVAAGAPDREYHHGTVWLPRIFGRAEKVVQVEPGTVTTVDLELTCNGGYLEVTLAGAISAKDRAYVATEVVQMRKAKGRVSEEHRERILRGTLHLESAERRMDVPVHRTALAELDTTARGPHTLNEWPMGETHRSDVLPPGQYTLRATFAERDPIEVPVEVKDGETTKVTLHFGG